MNKKPDLVVWNEKNGYDAKLKSYPTSAGGQGFDLTLLNSNSTNTSIPVLFTFSLIMLFV